MAFLEGRQVAYNSKWVRVNSIDIGDVIYVRHDNEEDRDIHGVVLKVDHLPFRVPEDDADSIALLDRITSAGEKDKVSPHFDEYAVITVAVAYFDEQGRPHLKEEEIRSGEWGFLKVYQ